MECCRCQVSEQERRLEPCPICKKQVCHECVYKTGGKSFCSKGCGSYFFFGEGEDDLVDET